MKHTKKILSLLLVMAMIFTLAIPAFAEEAKTATKITSAEQLVSGEYIMVASNGMAMKAIEGKWVTYVDFSGGVDAATAPVWTLTVDGSSVKMADSNGKYIAPSGGNNNGIANKEYDWAWSFADGMFVFAGTGADTVKLANNPGDTSGFANHFRAYKNTTIGDGSKYPYQFTLYKVETGTPIVDPTPSELLTNIGEQTFVAGSDEWVEFTFSTVANDNAGVMVYGGSDFGVAYESKIAALEYKAGDNWIDMKGQNFGGSTGFPLTDATSTFRVKFADDAAGEYTFNAFIKAVDGDEVLCTLEVPFVVAPAVGELDGKTVILHTNDVHGAIASYATIAALKAEYEAKGADVILADAGDYSQGTSYVSTSKGGSAIAMMNVAGYDVATLGNHEFDYGWAQLQENMKCAEFKVVCADVLENGETVFDGHTIIEKGDVKIGFFGMETPEAQTKANPALIQGLTFLAGDAMYACAQAQVDALKAEGADVVICLAHLGIDDESEPNRSVDMLANVEGIDFLIDGHSHSVLEAGPNGEAMQSTGTAFANIGVIVIDNATKAIVDNYLVPVTDESAKDEAVAAAAQDIIDRVKEEYGQVFAKSEVELNGDKAPNGNRDSETNMGDLICDAMLWTVMHQDGAIRPGVGGVVAITNGGGIRAWIHQGDITKQDVNTVLPFGNTIAVVYVTGAELLEALEASTYCTPTAVGGFPQVAGIDFSIATCAEYDANEETYPASTYYGPASINRVTINSINGKDFDPEATYAVITNNFCAAGGDTYYAFAAASAQFDTGIPLDEALMAYISEELGGVVGQQYAEPQGRITIGHPWVEVTVPGCVTNVKVFGDEEGNIVAGTQRVCPICGEEEFVELPLNPADHSMDPFTDISTSGLHDYIIAANLLGLANGYDDGTFRPKNNVTRAQYITMLWRLAGEPEAENTELTFADADQIAAPFRAAVAWGVEQGIIKGFDNNTFRPNANITRAQMASFTYRFICMLAETDAAPEELLVSVGYADEASIPAAHLDAVNCISNMGIMNGTGNNMFTPSGTANRGMAATVLVRLAILFIE